MESLSKYGGIDNSQIDLLDPIIAEKLNIAFDNIAHEASTVRKELELLKLEQEELSTKYTKEIDAVNSHSNDLKRKVDEYEGLLNSTEEKYQTAYSEKENFRTKLDDAVAINNELNCVIRGLENEKEILKDQLKHKIDQMESISSELDCLKAEAENVRKLKLDALIKLEDVTSRESSVKAQESRWSDELASLQRHNEWLEERLKQTSDQLLNVRRDSFQKCYSTEAELSLRNIELENTRKSVESLEESVRKLSQANEDYLNKLKLVTDEQIKMEQLYNNEIGAQKQLIDLYKDQIKELEEKNEELSSAASSIQSLLKTAYENISNLESEKISLKTQFAEEKLKLQSASQHLASELEQSQQLLDKFRVDGLSEEELKQLNPAVAATLSALKRGRSLTQLYADYVQVVEDRDQLKLDKQRLTEYVEELVDDLKEKAPILRNQQEEYKSIQTELKDLRVQCKCTAQKLEEAQAHSQECERRAGFYQREVKRLKQTCHDLSKQVKSLLYELELSKGTVFFDDHETVLTKSISQSSLLHSPNHQPLPDSSSTNLSEITTVLENIASATTIIDDHLVTWRNLEELQAQNQRLLCVARDLASQLEERERVESETTERITDLSSRVETLSGELEILRLSAREARTEANIANRQRDQYRTLLRRYDITPDKEEMGLSRSIEETEEQESTEQVSLNKSSGKLLSSNNISPSVVERLEETLSSLQAEFKRYREDKLESDNVYTTTIEQLRKECADARILEQKLAAQLDFTHEKFRALEANVTGYKQEITVLREMNARYSTSAATSEAELSRLRDELTHVNDRLTTAEVDARHFKRQLEAARANEARLRQEADALHRQDQMHTQLMRQLEAIQGNLEQKESIDRSVSERKVKHLEEQLTAAQLAVTEASKAAKITQETLQHELKLAREAAKSAEQESERLSSKIQELESKLKTLEPTNDVNSESDTSEISLSEIAKRSQNRIRELEHEVEKLQTSLESARNHSEEMRKLAEQAEDRLKELFEENEQLEQHMSQQFEETKQRCEFLEAQLDLEKKERQNLVNENIRTTEEAHKLNANLRHELATLQSELSSTKVRCESALELEAGAKAEIETHQQAALEARNKYERELTLHAHDVERLTETRLQLDSTKIELTNLNCELTQAKTHASSAIAELKSQTESWDVEKQDLVKQLKERNEEINLLQDQIVELTQQIVSLRKLLEQTNFGDQNTSTNDDSLLNSSKLFDTSRNEEELLQVISYLRRQKSISDAANDASSAEVSRLLLRIANLESKNEQLEAQLERELKAHELAMETSQRHSEVMERVEQLNLVTESNRLLRHERETLRNKLSEVETQLTKLESDVVPLKRENNSLSAHQEALLSEKRSLEEERDRWKERCNRLVETAQRMDPEQYRLACNERDELQRKLNRVEEEAHQNFNKLNELRTESEEQIKNLNTLLNEAQNACQEAEKRASESIAQETVLRGDLDKKETTIFKLREIGRKYRQEAESLRRQLNTNRSDEAELQTTSEALTEAKADLVTLRSDLSTLRVQYDQSCAVLTELSQLLNDLKSRDSSAVIVNPYLEGLGSGPDETSGNGQILLNNLRRLLPGLCDELDRLQQQSDVQKEKLLRTQLIESQLTKSQRDCAELRTRLTELQSIHVQPNTSSVSLQTNVTSPIAFDLEATDSTQTSHLSTTRISQPISSSLFVNSSAHLETITHVTGVETSTECAINNSTNQSIPAWIMRAAATVQPVQPTPAVTPPSSIIGSKQTAEIRPITSNVATVIPTPALQIIPTNTTAGPSETSSTTASTSMALCIPVSDISSGISSTSSFQSVDQTTSVLRGTFPRRVNLLNQSQSLSGSPGVSVVAPGLFGSSTGLVTTAPSSTVGISGKRHYEDNNGSSLDSTVHIISSVEDASTASADLPKTGDNLFSSCLGIVHQSGSVLSASEAKRLRQAISGGPSSSMSFTQAIPSPIVLGRSAFGFGVSTTPPLHATASRLVAGHQEPSSTCWTSSTVATGVAGIITPNTSGLFTTVSEESQLQPSSSSNIENNQSSTSVADSSDHLVEKHDQDKVGHVESVELTHSEVDTQCATQVLHDFVDICDQTRSDAQISSSSISVVPVLQSPNQEETLIDIQENIDQERYFVDDHVIQDEEQLEEEARESGLMEECAESVSHESTNHNNNNNYIFDKSSHTIETEFYHDKEDDNSADIYEDENSQAAEVEGEQEDYMEEDYDEAERSSGTNSESFSEPEDEADDEVIELSSGSGDEVHESGVENEVQSESHDEEPAEDDFQSADVQANVYEEATENSPLSSQHQSDEEPEVEVLRDEDNNQEESLSTTSEAETQPLTNAPTTSIRELGSSQTSTVGSSAEVCGTGLFGSFAVTSCSTSASGLFSGFKPSSFSGSITGNSENLLASNTSSGLFKSLLTTNLCPSTNASLFKPSIFVSSAPSTKASEFPVSTISSPVRPKIQPIVWDSTSPPSSQTSFSDATGNTTGAARRKKWGSSITGIARAGRRPLPVPGSSSLKSSAHRNTSSTGPTVLRGGILPRRG